LLKEILAFYHIDDCHHPMADDISTKCDVLATQVSRFLRLIDCPVDGACLAHMEPVCLYLIQSYCDYNSNTMYDGLAKDVADAWNGIKALSEDSDVVLSDSIHGYMNTNSAYAFHFSVFPFEIASDRKEFSKSYHALGAFLHRRLFYWRNKITIEKPDINMKGYISHLGLAARKLVQGSCFESTEAAFDIPLLGRSVIVKKTKESKNINGVALLSSGDSTYIKDLMIRDDRNYETRKKEPSEREYRGRTDRWIDWEMKPFKSSKAYLPDPSGYGGPFYRDAAGATETRFQFFSTANIHPEAEAYGEHPSDYIEDIAISMPPSWLSSPWEEKRRNQGQIESMVQALKVQPWDDRCVSFDGLKKILSAVEGDEGKWRRTVRPIVLLSLLVGMTPGTLMKMGCMCAPDSQKDEDIDAEAIADGDCWFDVRKGVMWKLSARPTMGDDERSYNIGLIERYELPQIILNQLAGFPAFIKRIFCKTDIKQAEMFLGSLGLDGLTKISISRLRLSFYAYFVNGAGFPTLLADYLSSTESFYLLSQHYYITIPAKHLTGEWLRMCELFLEGIRNRHDVAMTLSYMRYRHVLDGGNYPNESNDFIGAPDTPKISIFRNHLACLASNFPRDSDDLIRSSDYVWNTYMAYLYAFYAICTGQRPLRDPCPRQGLINSTLKTAHVSDKHNRVNLEFRDIPLCRSLVNAISFHQPMQQEWLGIKRMQGYQLMGAADAFLMADEKQRMLMPVSPNLLDLQLGDLFGSEYFSGLKNGCRHLLLSLLHWEGVHQEWIDYISGHRHAGTEPTHICSPSSSASIGERLSQIVENKVVGALGLRSPVCDRVYS